MSEAERVLEARGELATAIGLYEYEHRERAGDDHSIRLRRALDRLDRAVEGEDYIEKHEALRERTNGAFHFTPPPAEALPVRGFGGDV